MKIEGTISLISDLKIHYEKDEEKGFLSEISIKYYGLTLLRTSADSRKTWVSLQELKDGVSSALYEINRIYEFDKEIAKKIENEMNQTDNLVF